MSRYVSFRDFDWLLLVFVLMICGLGVMEIRSATMHTKFAGSHIKQIYWVAAGVGAMFLMSLINYQALAGKDSLVLHCRGRVADGRAAFWAEVSGRAALDQNARWQPLPALRVGQADPDSGGGEVFSPTCGSANFPGPIS